MGYAEGDVFRQNDIIHFIEPPAGVWELIKKLQRMEIEYEVTELGFSDDRFSKKNEPTSHTSTLSCILLHRYECSIFGRFGIFDPEKRPERIKG